MLGATLLRLSSDGRWSSMPLYAGCRLAWAILLSKAHASLVLAWARRAVSIRMRWFLNSTLR
eukprot:2712094-Pyramimonas_sp.AAC.1